MFKLTEAMNYTVAELVKSEVRIFLLYSTQVLKPEEEKKGRRQELAELEWRLEEVGIYKVGKI